MSGGKWEKKSTNSSCISNQLSCSSSSWMIDEELCCDSGTETCQLAPYTNQHTNLYMPFCCPKSGDQPCTNLVHGNVFSPPPCPTTPVAHKRCNHNANVDGKFGESWCCPDIPGVSCGQTNKICLYSNPGGSSGVSSTVIISGSMTSTINGLAATGTQTNSAVPTNLGSNSGGGNQGLSTAARAGLATSLIALGLLGVVFGIFLMTKKRRSSPVRSELNVEK